MISNCRIIRYFLNHLKIGKFSVWLWIGYVLVFIVSPNHSFDPMNHLEKRKISGLSLPLVKSNRLKHICESLKNDNNIVKTTPQADRLPYRCCHGNGTTKSTSFLNYLTHIKQVAEATKKNLHVLHKNKYEHPIQKVMDRLICGVHRKRRCKA